MKKTFVFWIAIFLLVSFAFATEPSLAMQDSWAAKTPMGIPKTGFGAVAVNGTIYVLGGHPFGTTQVTIDHNSAYDPKTDSWQSKQNMPGLLAWFATAEFKEEIYVMGGAWFISDSSIKNETWVYNPEENNWRTKADMPTARTDMQANIVDGKIYVIGGRGTNESVLAVNEVYDPVTDSWSTRTPIPTPVTNYASAVVNDKIYIIGGLTLSESYPYKNRVDLTQIYDTKADSWSLGAPLPNIQSSISAAATTGANAPKRIFVIGDGLNQIYNPSNDSWTLGTPIPNSDRRLTNFDDAELVTVNDQLYALGGIYQHNGQYYSVNEQYTPMGYGTPDPSTPTSAASPKVQTVESFPSVMVAVVVIVASFGIGALAYLKKRRR